MQFEVPMKGNVSSYVCNHGSSSGERDTASPRLWAMLGTQASDEEVDDVFSRHPLYCGRAGRDVIGWRRPTGGVFICMLQTRVTLMAFPIATPRGRSVSFPTRGTMVTYVTWDVLQVNGALLYHPKEAQNHFYGLFHLLFPSGGMICPTQSQQLNPYPSSRNG